MTTQPESRPCRAHHNPECKATIAHSYIFNRSRDCPNCAALGRHNRADAQNKKRREQRRKAREKKASKTIEQQDKAKDYNKEYNKTHRKKQSPPIPKRQARKDAFSSNDLQHSSVDKLIKAVKKITSGEAVFTR